MRCGPLLGVENQHLANEGGELRTEVVDFLEPVFLLRLPDLVAERLAVLLGFVGVDEREAIGLHGLALMLADGIARRVLIINLNRVL